MGKEPISTIESAEDWEGAAAELVGVVKQRKQIAAHWGERVSSSRSTYKAATLGRDEFDKPLKEREEDLRSAMSLFESPGNEMVGVRQKVDFFVEDETKIPQHLMQPDLKKIKEIVESMGMMTDIEGIGIARIYPIFIRPTKTKNEEN